MKIAIDTEQVNNTIYSIDMQIKNYREIIDKFYKIIDNMSTNNVWGGTAASNYIKYLNNKKQSYIDIENTLYNFNQTLKNNLRDIDYVINNSRVSEND